MRTCPQCHAELPEQAVLAGLCPKCGVSLEESAKDAADAAGPRQAGRETSGPVDATMLFESEKSTQGPRDVQDATIDVPPHSQQGPEVDSDGTTRTAQFESEGERTDPGASDSAATVDLREQGKRGRDTDKGLHLETAAFEAGQGPPTIGDNADGTQGTIDLPGAGAGSGGVPTGGATAADSDRIRQLWGGKVPSGSHTGATLKIESTTTLGAGTLLIKSRSVAASGSLPEGQAADYELLDRIGQGGMGVVYSARQANFNRMVAVKMLRPGAKGKNKRTEFVSEAVTTGDLDHPNIVPVYDLGTNEEGALFYAMKCVQGTPWDDVLRDKTLPENLDILLKTADAMAFAHANGVIHRDLKPENVMLGSYGEVLVMDWGLAVRFRVAPDGTVRSTGTSMGGTPAYMAPELVLGPMERIGPAADIYLLGAMLYEIVTGKPPHAGKTPMECLFAAADNAIQPTDASGELLEIALKAMETEPKHRYKSVLAMQAALRDYQSHSESIALLENARRQFAEAERTGDYQDYARALFGCEEACALWGGNEAARQEIVRVRLAYATAASGREDYDLAESLLDPDTPDHVELRTKVLEAKEERDAKVRRLRNAKRIAVGLVATVLAVVTTAYFEIRKQRDLAEDAKQRAEVAWNQESLARTAAEQAKSEAIAARDVAEQRRLAEEKARRDEEIARLAAVAAKEEAEVRRKEAVAAKEEAERKRIEAEAARKAAEIAKRAEEYEAYVAQIGLAAAKVDDNAFGEAQRLLAECRESEFRNWEWGRLWHLCRQSIETIPANEPVESVAFGPEGRRVLLGCWDGTARVVDIASDGEATTLPHGGFLNAVAFAHRGQLVATGGNDRRVKVWNLSNRTPIHELEGHEDAVLSVAFSRDDRWLLSSSYDGTARLWDVETGELLDVLEGHSWWVWQASFSSDASRIVTAGQDGRAILWSIAVDGPRVACQRVTEFTGHSGPVRTAAFSPDGEEVVSGDEAGNMLVWKPSEVHPIDLAARIAGLPEAAPPSRSLEGHDDALSCVTYSRDGNLIASAGNDNVVKVWDARTGEPIKTLRGHGGRVRSCDFSPDGQYLLSGSHDGLAKVWSLDGYREVQVLKGRLLQGHADIVLSARFSPDGNRIVTTSRDRTARIWDTATGEVVATLREGHEFLASSAVFFRDGRRVLTGAGDNTVRMWDVAAGTQLLQFNDTGRSAALALSENEKWIATGSGGNAAQVFDARSGELVQKLTPGREGNGQAAVTSLAFSCDDSLLLGGDAYGRCTVWQFDENAETWKEHFSLRGHSRRISDAIFLPDGTRALTSSWDHTVAQWDLASGKELPAGILRHPQGVTSMALLPDGERVVTTCDDGCLRVWSIAQAEVLAEMRSADESLQFVRVSPDGKHALTTCSATRKVRLWDLKNYQEIFHPDRPREAALDFTRLGGLVWHAVFTPDGRRVLSVGGNDARIWQIGVDKEQMSFSPHGTVADAEFSPDGRFVVTASWDNSAKIWDAATGRAIRKLAGGHQRAVNSAVFSPNGKTVLTAGDDGRGRFWDSASGELEEAALIGHDAGIRHAVYSADGRLIVTASDDKTARIWNADSLRTVQTLVGHEWAVLDAAFNRDGSVVATGSEDNRARIYRVETGELLQALEGHTAAVTAVAFSPDGRRLLTGSRDHSVKLWDTESGKEILSLRGHEQEVTSVVFSPDGRSALSASRDGTAILWLAAEPQ